MARRPCLGPALNVVCPTRMLVNGSRCQSCAARWQKRKDARRPERRTHAAITSNAALVAEHKLTYGDWCPGLPAGPAAHPAHPCADLVADHIDPVAWTRDEFGPRRVICRSANSRLGATVRRIP